MWFYYVHHIEPCGVLTIHTYPFDTITIIYMYICYRIGYANHLLTPYLVTVGAMRQ